MNSSRSFSLLLVLVALVATAGIAGAVTISQEDTPTEVEVGEQVTATYVFTELYQNPQYEQWQLEGATELVSVTWTVQLIDQAGNVQEQISYDNQTFFQRVNIEDNTAEVQVQVTGTVPEVGNWSYEDQQPFLFAEFNLARQGGTSTQIDRFTVARYTEGSRNARNQIEAARSAIEAAGGNSQAETTLQSAISAYNAANFDNAIQLANQAESTARGAQRQSQTIRLALYAVGAIVVIGGLIGAAYWYRSRRGTSKL